MALDAERKVALEMFKVSGPEGRATVPERRCPLLQRLPLPGPISAPEIDEQEIPKCLAETDSSFCL